MCDCKGPIWRSNDCGTVPNGAPSCCEVSISIAISLNWSPLLAGTDPVTGFNVTPVGRIVVIVKSKSCAPRGAKLKTSIINVGASPMGTKKGGGLGSTNGFGCCGLIVGLN